MDASFPINQQLSNATTRFFDKYLNRTAGQREHISLLFIDRPLPAWFMHGLQTCTHTTWVVKDAREIDSQRDVVALLWDPERRYVSVHDYVTSTFFPIEHTAVRFAEVSRGIDYTSFEFPRFDVSDTQMETLLARYVCGNPRLHERLADSFYELLADDPAYEVRIRSGPEMEHTLTVTGPKPWMDLAGPLVEGNIRFAPGAELFYHSTDVSGTLYCEGGLNLLPLRHPETDVALCRRLIALGASLPQDPVTLEIHTGRVTGLSSRSGLAQQFQDVFSVDPAFSHVVEVGVGLSDACGPLIADWAASSNEAVPGIHIGVGADPANTRRFNTRVHLDFVCPEVEIAINGKVWFDRGRFLND